MPDDGPKDPPMADSAAGDQLVQKPVATSQLVQEVPSPVRSQDHAELLTRARAFLASPEARLQDSDAKRTFLAEKGFNSSEVDQLLRESPPSVPPRTYPPSPSSNLPSLLVGVARIFTWLTGTSAIVLFVYYTYLFPKLVQSFQARLALRRHQSTLITRLTASATALKATQAESYKDLPRTIPSREDSQYAQCHGIDDLLSHIESSREPGVDIPDVTILRCALEELGRSKVDGISTEELFRHLESKLPWLDREDGAARQNDLWNQLNAYPLFMSMPQPGPPDSLPPDHPSRLLWKYVPPPPPPALPLLESLANLKAVLPHTGGPSPATSARQRTLQALSDFTGYITTQTYSFGLPSMRGTNGAGSGGSLLEDEVRREIRALKGLVLNRRSFLPFGAGASGS